MASLPIGSDVLLELKSESFRLTLTGRPCASLPGDCFLRISSGEDFSVTVNEVLREKPEKEGLCFVFSHPKCPLLVCGESYSLKVESDREEVSLSADIPLHPQGFQDGRVITGFLTPAWEAGRVKLTVYQNERPILNLCCMLLPREASLREAVMPMQEELTRATYGLTFGKDGHAYQSMVPLGGVSGELWSFWRRFREAKSAYWAALEEIKAHPHKLPVKVYRLTPADRIRKADRKTFLSCLRPDGKRLAPYDELSPDTPENQTVLYLLDRTVLKLERILSLSQDPELTREVSLAREDLLIRRHGLFPGVEVKPKPLSLSSSVFRESRGYRSFFRLEHFIHSYLLPGEGSVLLPVRPLEDLYADWCFICIHHLLQNVLGFRAEKPLAFDLEGLVPSVSLNTHAEYTDPKNGAMLSLTPIHHRMFSLTRYDGRKTTRMVFLSDYHFIPGLFASASPKELTDAVKELPPTLPDDTVSYGLCLYPQTRQNRRPFQELRVGKPMALPLLPDWEELLLNVLKGLAFGQEKEGFLPSPLASETQKALQTADWERNVLVGALSKPEQLSAAMRYRFYHLPADKLGSEALSVKKIAIYQSSRLFGVQAGIYLVGEVTEVRRVKRCEIGWLPKKSDEPYLLYRVACWEKLSHPIAPDGEGLVHLLTTPFLLDHGQTLATLRLESETDYRLFLYLERVNNQNCGFIIGNFRILFTDTEILLIHHGKTVKTYDRAALSGKPGAVFNRLRVDLEEYKLQDNERRSG